MSKLKTCDVVKQISRATGGGGGGVFGRQPVTGIEKPPKVHFAIRMVVAV